MNKVDLINEVAQVVGTKAKAQEAIECVLSSITTALKDGETVSLVGFGTFKVVDRAARKGRNPQTGEEIDIAASRVPRFVAGESTQGRAEVTTCPLINVAAFRVGPFNEGPDTSVMVYYSLSRYLKAAIF